MFVSTRMFEVSGIKNTFYYYMELLRCLLILIILCMFYPSTTQHGGGVLSGWYRHTQCKHDLLHVLRTFTDANALNQNTASNWSLYFPCGYNKAESEYNTIKSTDSTQKIFIIKGHDNLSRKDRLWESLREKYGSKAVELMPNTYRLLDRSDVQRLMTDYNPHTVYIMKKNIQRQQGLKITKSKQELIEGRNQGFVIAQEMLQDPYLIDGRKTNCRVYLLIVCKNGIKTGYVYNNGYMYYTPKSFAKFSTETDRVITAGLSTDRKDETFYKTHPLTIGEWQTSPKLHSIDLFGRIGVLLSKVLSATSPSFCSGTHLKQQMTFQLFGCDVAFNANLRPQLIEINKGPDLSSKSEKEALLKNDLITCMFKVVGIKTDVPTIGKFTKVWQNTQ